MNRRTKGLIRSAIGIAFVLVVLYLGHLDKQAAEAELQEYCDNVRDGVWPDYADSYAKECTP